MKEAALKMLKTIWGIDKWSVGLMEGRLLGIGILSVGHCEFHLYINYQDFVINISKSTGLCYSQVLLST